jgi:hypothetical protein
MALLEQPRFSTRQQQPILKNTRLRAHTSHDNDFGVR